MPTHRTVSAPEGRTPPHDAIRTGKFLPTKSPQFCLPHPRLTSLEAGLRCSLAWEPSPASPAPIGRGEGAPPRQPGCGPRLAERHIHYGKNFSLLAGSAARVRTPWASCFLKGPHPAPGCDKLQPWAPRTSSRGCPGERQRVTRPEGPSAPPAQTPGSAVPVGHPVLPSTLISSRGWGGTRAGGRGKESSRVGWKRFSRCNDTPAAGSTYRVTLAVRSEPTHS